MATNSKRDPVTRCNFDTLKVNKTVKGRHVSSHCNQINCDFLSLLYLISRKDTSGAIICF